MTSKKKKPAAAARPKREPQNKIRLWRQHRGMTTEQVALDATDDAGNPMTASLISQVEVGRCSYTQNSLERIARALKVEPWMLLAVDPKEQGMWVITHDDPDHRWQRLPVESRMKAAAFLRDLMTSCEAVMRRRWPGLDEAS